ncbi:hypothetical protein SOCE26_029580 [Sorangium cellulosum]|uniref:Uncharacterized protein n=1 Tax=Sorangium cellulosum TaxID=56 RepID=A0A2L0EQF1_SORCE|nr:hypothetical protein [Sorangium cellulosum]AUX41538.1 hypothetical protein SOCE26_029580 [Sorangium cellulosum]
MRSRWRHLIGFHLSLASLSLAASGCQKVLGIRDVTIDEGQGGAGGHPGQGGAPAEASSSGGGGAGSTSSGPVAEGFSFTILSPNVAVPLGGKNVIEIEIRREGGFDGEVTVEPRSAPAGLLVESATIPGGQTRGEVVVGAQAPLVLGAEISFTLEATSGDLEPRTGSVTDAIVTGRPGALDETFGAATTGVARASFGSDDGGGFFDLDVVGEQIVAAGSGAGGLGGSSFAIARLTSSGQLDPGFAEGTVMKARLGSSSGSSSRAVAVGHQLNGRIIAVGSHEESGVEDIALLRPGAAGGLGDPLFGASGKSLIDLGGLEQVSDGLVLANDRILVAGQRDGQLMVARATSSGDLDTTFAAPDGYETWALVEPSSARAIAVDSRGRIVVAGQAGADVEGDLVIARFLADGQPDTAFGTGGHRIIESPGSDEHAVAVALLPDGRIVVGGDSNAGGNVDFQLVRLLADGSLDPSFGTEGIATIPVTGGDDIAEDMVLLPDGRILVVGNTRGGATAGPVLARTTRDGAPDPHFGTDGVAPLYVGDNGSIHCVAVYPGHKVVIGGGDEGGSPGPGTYGVVARLWM